MVHLITGLQTQSVDFVILLARAGLESGHCASNIPTTKSISFFNLYTIIYCVRREISRPNELQLDKQTVVVFKVL